MQALRRFAYAAVDALQRYPATASSTSATYGQQQLIMMWPATSAAWKQEHRPWQRMFSSLNAGIIMHDSAVQRLKELQAETPNEPVFLRVEVDGGGCSGFQYKFSLDSKSTEDDIVFEQRGVKLVCDNTSLEFLQGAIIEFEDSLMRSAFQVASNPNSESTCGCGSSFVAKM